MLVSILAKPEFFCAINYQNYFGPTSEFVAEEKSLRRIRSFLLLNSEVLRDIDHTAALLLLEGWRSATLWVHYVRDLN